MTDVVISGSGLWTPKSIISNDELVAAYNAYVENYNAQHAEGISAGDVEALRESSAEFIEKVSGIRRRYVMDRKGPLDPEIMQPMIEQRPDEELSFTAEAGAEAARDALARAGKQASDVDVIIVSASTLERAYPAVAIEIQQELGAGGYAYDMNVACASAAFALQHAYMQITTSGARSVLVINPELASTQLEYRDRDSHFIFGDASTAMLVERADLCTSNERWQILDSKLLTKYSSNVRNNIGPFNRCDPKTATGRDKLFAQQGRRVFKEVCPWVAKQLSAHINEFGMSSDDVSRLWLHQANINMNMHIARKVLGREPSNEDAPIVLDEFANTSSAGSVIAFHRHRGDLPVGAVGVLCAFGAGYSYGSVITKRIQ